MKNTQAYNKTSKMNVENEEKIVHRSEYPQISGSQLIGYYYICECGYAEADYEADEHTHCPKCGGRYEDTITSTTTIANEQVNEGDNMDNKQMFAIALLSGQMTEGLEWATAHYPLEMAVIAKNTSSSSSFGFAMKALRTFDAIMSQKVLDGELEMEEMESIKIHSTIHAFYFFRDGLKGGDEWEDFFLPPTLQLEAQYSASQEEDKVKEAILRLVEDGWEYKYGSLSFKVRDDMTIADYKTTQSVAMDILGEAGIEVSDYDSSIHSICLDLRADGEYLEGFSEDGYYFETREEYDKFLHETDV